MKIPLDWLKEYVDLEGLSTQEISDAFTQIGLMLDKPFDGKVFDLEHRFDRSDWLAILGCSRDLAAYLSRGLKLPKTYSQEGKKPSANQLVDIKVECPDAVNRFNTRVFRNIKVQDSPDWLKNRLEEYGIQSINNIVDITNYVMVELGQPMHAQDLAKFRKNSSGGKEIVIRKARNEEKIVTFLGDEVTLYPDAFVLTQDGVATVLGGVVGGRETGVDESTTDIILDAGNYNQNIIRKVSRKLKIQNETVLRYDKFLHTNLTQYAIERATYLILELAGGEYYQNIDWNPKEYKPKEMTLRHSRILQLAGFELPEKTVVDILTRLDYKLQSQTKETITLIVPYFRTDVEVEDDIVSDILRINGYAKIPTAQIQGAPPKEITPEIYKFEDTLRDSLIQLGAHEHITDPLVSCDENLAGNQIILENSQNSQKNALRISIADTLKSIVPNYVKNQIPNEILFEIGKIYTQEADKKDYATYIETRVLECLVFDKEKGPKELHATTSSLLHSLLSNLGIDDYSLKKQSNLLEAIVIVDDLELGSIKYNGFTLFTENLLASTRQPQRIITDIQANNSLETSLVIPNNLPVGTIIDALKKTDEIVSVSFLDEYKGKELGNDRRSISLKIRYKEGVSSTETLSMNKSVIDKLKKTYGVVVRD